MKRQNLWIIDTEEETRVKGTENTSNCLLRLWAVLMCLLALLSPRGLNNMNLLSHSSERWISKTKVLAKFIPPRGWESEVAHVSSWIWWLACWHFLASLVSLVHHPHLCLHHHKMVQIFPFYNSAHHFRPHYNSIISMKTPAPNYVMSWGDEGWVSTSILEVHNPALRTYILALGLENSIKRHTKYEAACCPRVWLRLPLLAYLSPLKTHKTVVQVLMPWT